MDEAMAARLTELRGKRAEVAARQRGIRRLQARVEARRGRDAAGGEPDAEMARREDAEIAGEVHAAEQEDEARRAHERADTAPE